MCAEVRSGAAKGARRIPQVHGSGVVDADDTIAIYSLVKIKAKLNICHLSSARVLVPRHLPIANNHWVLLASTSSAIS